MSRICDIKKGKEKIRVMTNNRGSQGTKESGRRAGYRRFQGEGSRPGNRKVKMGRSNQPGTRSNHGRARGRRDCHFPNLQKWAEGRARTGTKRQLKFSEGISPRTWNVIISRSQEGIRRDISSCESENDIS